MSQTQTNRIKVANPPIEDEIRTYLTSDSDAAATKINTLDNTGFVLTGADDYYILIAEYGSEKPEIVLVDANDADTANNSFKIWAAKYSHEASDPVTFIRYNQIRFYGATSSGGTKVLLETKDVDPSQLFTEYTYTGDTYNYFYTAYYNSNDDEISGYSDEIENSSYTRRSIKRIIESGLRKALTTIDKGVDPELSWDVAIETIQDGIDEIFARKRMWSFLRTIDSTKSTVASQAYIKKPSNLLMLEFIKVDGIKIDKINRNEYNNYTNSDITTTGKPSYYIEKNDKYYFWPIPDAVYSVDFEYYKTIATITSNLSTEIPLAFSPVLIYYCASQFAYIRGNDKRGDKMYAMFVKLLEEQVIEYSGPEQSGEAERIDQTSIYGEDIELI
jgi:hypothetical protein